MLKHIWASEEVENPLNLCILLCKKFILYLTTCAPEGKGRKN